MATPPRRGALNNLTLSTARALAPEVRVTRCVGGMLGRWTRNILTEEQYQEWLKEAETAIRSRRVSAVRRRGRGAV